jgi:hypothetical protein
MVQQLQAQLMDVRASSDQDRMALRMAEVTDSGALGRLASLWDGGLVPLGLAIPLESLRGLP